MSSRGIANPAFGDGKEADMNDTKFKQLFDPAGDYEVSTIQASYEAVAFETMVFGSGDWSGFQQRYATEAEAVAGHGRIVEKIKAGEKPE